MNVKTPCIGVCSTGIGDIVCRGCKRFAHEIIDWNAYNNEQKHLVIERLDGFIQQIVSHKIDIFDEAALKAQMEFQQIRFEPELSCHRWVYELLRNGASQIKDTDSFGFRVKDDWQRFSLDQIKQFLEQDFYTLSCAYHERYVALETKTDAKN